MAVFKKILKWFGIFIGVLFLIGLLGAIFGDKKPTENSQSSQTETTATPEPVAKKEPLMQTTAKELAAAYDKNTVSADAKFKNQKYEVTGTVSEISTDVMDNAVIAMKGGVNEFLEPQFVLADNEKSKAGEVEKGQKITLICTGAGDMIKMARSEDCVFK